MAGITVIVPSKIADISTTTNTDKQPNCANRFAQHSFSFHPVWYTSCFLSVNKIDCKLYIARCKQRNREKEQNLSTQKLEGKQHYSKMCARNSCESNQNETLSRWLDRFSLSFSLRFVFVLYNVTMLCQWCAHWFQCNLIYCAFSSDY